VHHPLRLGALAGTAAVEDERLLEADGVAGAARGGGVDGAVDAGGLPEAGAGDPVGPDAVPVLPPPQAEEVPLLLSQDRARFCKVSVISYPSLYRNAIIIILLQSPKFISLIQAAIFIIGSSSSCVN